MTAWLLVNVDHFYDDGTITFGVHDEPLLTPLGPSKVYLVEPWFPRPSLPRTRELASHVEILCLPSNSKGYISRFTGSGYHLI